MTTDENGKEIPVPFIGPKKSVETWMKWGVPEERCVVVKPGDVIKVKEIEIVALDSFDRTCIVTTDSTGEDREELAGICPTDMDDKAVNYLIKTPGGNIYHSGDSHYSIYYAKHGKDHDIDVAFGSYGENPVGMQDKMTSIDILRMAEALQTDVVIPIHYDVWTNFKADPQESICCITTKKMCWITNSILLFGMLEENMFIRQIRTNVCIIIAAVLKIVLKRNKISHIVPVCNA